GRFVVDVTRRAVTHQSHGSAAGKNRSFPKQSLIEAAHLRLGSVRFSRKTEFDAQNVGGLETSIDIGEAQESVHGQTGTNEKNERECHLGDDQGARSEERRVGKERRHRWAGS